MSSASLFSVAWAAGREAMFSPRRSMVTLSAMARVSLSLWVIMMMVLPSFFSCLSMAKSSCTS